MSEWMIRLEEGGCRSRYHGWILYEAQDHGINMHYIDLYRKACRQNGMSAAFGICWEYEKNQPDSGSMQCTAYDAGGLAKAERITEMIEHDRPSYVINRTRDYRLAGLLEGQGIPVFNCAELTELGNDKAKAYRYMQQRAVPVMPVVYHADTEPPWYPAVIKSCAGHGGSEVYLVRNSEEYRSWHSHIRRNTCRYIMQQAASDLGKDVRVYIVGNRITAGVLRTSKTDFRSNYCLGGQVRLYELSLKERELVMRVTDGLDIGMAGIDFIFHHGSMVFNEIEDAAGARALYTLTDYDLVKDFVECICSRICVKTERKSGTAYKMPYRRPDQNQ